MIVVSSDAEAGKEDETLKKVDAVLQKVREGNFSDKDIKRAQKTLTNLYRFGNETNAGKADNWGVYETIDKMDFSTTYMDDINKLSKADLVSAAQKYFGRNHYRLIFKAGRPGGGRG